MRPRFPSAHAPAAGRVKIGNPPSAPAPADWAPGAPRRVRDRPQSLRRPRTPSRRASRPGRMRGADPASAARSIHAAGSTASPARSRCAPRRPPPERMREPTGRGRSGGAWAPKPRRRGQREAPRRPSRNRHRRAVATTQRASTAASARPAGPRERMSHWRNLSPRRPTCPRRLFDSRDQSFRAAGLREGRGVRDRLLEGRLGTGRIPFFFSRIVARVIRKRELARTVDFRAPGRMPAIASS